MQYPCLNTVIVKNHFLNEIIILCTKALYFVQMMKYLTNLNV